MPRLNPPKTDVAAYGDHEVITPDTSRLRKAVRIAGRNEPDPVAQAEKALAQMAAEFPLWMRDECDRLQSARHKVRDTGLVPETRQELFLAAHDIKGESTTFGFPEVRAAADSLCRLLEHAPDMGKIPLSIVDQHVDAIRAIVREHVRGDIGEIASALTGKLRQVTDEFLMAENRHRPDVLKTIAGG